MSWGPRAGSFGTSFGIVLQVCDQPVPAAFPSVSRFLVAAERARRVETVEGVGPHHSGPELVGHGQDPAALVAPDARGETVRRIVRLRDGFVWCPEGEH